MSVQDAKDGRRAIQKRTFTRWMNVYLSRHDPPTEVCDLFQDIQDGRILMMLLEELTGCKLLYRFRSSSHRIFRLNNISKALAFLDDRHVKLLGIDASAVADGVPSVVLNLIWNIILHFQIKEMTGGLRRRLSSSLSSLSTSSELTDESAPNLSRDTTKGPKYSKKTIKSLLHWVQRCTVKFGVEVHDFGRSWRNGLAFLALIKSINPGLMDLRQSLTKDPEENLEQAFRTAQHHLDIPPLLEPRDVTCSCPDEKSVITYVSMFLRHCPDMVEDLSTAVNSPHISKFRSLETLADREEDQPVFSSLETSHELLLWKRWARRSSRNKRKSSSALQPPSPLDANVVNPEIRSWLVKSLDHGYSKTKNNEIHFSLSSEEGIYSVTPLDSDEEDAYSYILDLNKDVSQIQAKRQVPRVEEESEDNSLISDEEQTEMFGFDEDDEADVHIQDKDLNGDLKEDSAEGERIKTVQRENWKESQTKQKEERFSKNPMGESQTFENCIEFSPPKVMDLDVKSKEMSGIGEKEERTEEKAQVEARCSKEKNKDDLHYDNIEAKNTFQAPNALTGQKADKDETFRDIGNSGTSRDSFIEKLTGNMNEATYENGLKKLGQTMEEVGEALPSHVDVSVTRGQNIVTDKFLHSQETYREMSKARYKSGSCSITARERGVLSQHLAPSNGLNWTELHIMLFLWMLLYCYFIGQQISS